ncbi:PAS domain-containing protein [Phycisphaera mikurensis]|uniref:histidine kinase n=1 Tax=Phycisphaera mikurensis (strain NBRC 102666 / KCTC 22515 / FYK2301M01) TaxID=1142394 RepID=I0IBG5_PHYMF|nr:PAS domain-containing protein [Phycisphaera mikurensis]MBB6442864.1 PAS domain S-box-containing protein [Phycisphaera mikurensis]BAM02603.1 putative signaling protein [Phycisphaera mikurensis NBRC 102666]
MPEASPPGTPASGPEGPSSARAHAATRVQLLKVRAERNELAFRCERLEAAMDAAGDGIWDVDLQNDRVHYSEGWARMLGLNRAELGSAVSTALDLMHPDDRDRVLNVFEEHIAATREDEYVIGFRMRHRTGTWVEIFSRGAVTRDHEGRAVRFIGTHVDVTRRKRELAELSAARAEAAEIRERLAEALGGALAQLARLPGSDPEAVEACRAAVGRTRARLAGGAEPAAGEADADAEALEAALGRLLAEAVGPRAAA